MGTASAGATPQPLHRLQPLLLASTKMTSGNPNQTCPAPTARSATPGRGCHRPPRPIFAVTVQEHLNSARDHQKVCTSTPNLSSASVEWILRPTPANREIVFHSGNGNCTIVSQPCFTTRNLRTKLCGIRSQTEEQEFVDPFKSWYLETLSISEMENRRASPGPRLGEGLN